jgi:hypothetical protein
MNSSTKKTPILIIEDEEEHASAITARLGSSYDVVHLTSLDKVKLYNYKATNPDSQIIIVDLVLGTEDDPHEGYKTIHLDLWPLDRTTFFIVFSQYLVQKNLPVANRFEPHWAFVSKEVSSGKLSAHCLDNLFSIVEQCTEYSSPSLEIPQYDAQKWTRQILQYKSRFSIVDSRKTATQNIERSVETLNELANASSQYTKVGAPSRKIAIGIYGSCGRMEMRADSDIECSVYFSGDTNSLVASTFWNRITRYIGSKNWHYEGRDEIESSPVGFLLPDQVGERFENKFIPLIASDRFIGADFDKEPEVRDRHFQILTELRPVFNPHFILEMKKEMILRNCQSPDLRTIVDSPYTQKIVSQFFMDVQPESLGDWNNLKRFCYRTLNIFALQLFFIRRLLVDVNLRIQNDDEWNEFFSNLCDPGIVKIIQFEEECRDAEVPKKEKNKLIKEIEQLTQSYFEIYSQFVETEKDERPALRRAAVSTMQHFVNLLEQMKRIDFFEPVINRAGWLFGTQRVTDLKNQLS